MKESHIRTSNLGKPVIFNGLQFSRGIRPMDVDMFIEFGRNHENLFVLAEFKHYHAKEDPKGQYRAYEALVNALSKDRPTILFIAEHETDHGSIMAADTVVNRYYYGNQWRETVNPIYLDAAIQRFIDAKAKNRT